MLSREAQVVVATILLVKAGEGIAKYAYNKYKEWKARKYVQENPLTRQTETSNDRDTVDDEARRFRKVETVVQRRTSRIVLVLEGICDIFNEQAVYRSAECLGIQHIHIIEPAFYKVHKSSRKIARQSADFITVHRYKTSKECIDALKAQGYALWVTDLSQVAEPLDNPELELPDRVALVIGREADGASEEMLNAAERRVYLPIHGFADSLNLSVAAALVIQQLFFICPDARGAMTEAERSELRRKWGKKIAKNDAELHEYLQQPPAPFYDLRRPVLHRESWRSKKITNRIHERENELKAEIENLPSSS